MRIIKKYKYLLVLIFAAMFSSCADSYREITPFSNPDSIKVKLEILDLKSKSGGKTEFSLRFINFGERDLGRCRIRLDNKYEHQIEGLIHVTEDWEGKPETSMIKAGESSTIMFGKDYDNYTIFGINDENFGLPEIIELTCLDGKVIWKTR